MIKIINMIAVALTLVFVAFTVSAQSAPTQVFITWKAANFYPANFEGKALPSFGTPVTVAVEATKNGTWLDLAQHEITWELDGKYIGGGRGVKFANFTATKGAGDTHFVHISMTRGSETIENSLRIPVSNQVVTVDVPYPEARGNGGTMRVRAVPFFFNVSSLSDLLFIWTVDGVRKNTGSDSELTISGGSDFTTRAFSISLETRNQANPAETARTTTQLLLEQ